MSRPTQITIDLAALQYNFQRVRQLAPAAARIAMVKANAYGHGAVTVAAALADAEAFGVAMLEEGLLLRAAGIKNPIVLIEGLFAATELPQAAAANFTLVVHHSAQIEMLEKTNGIQPFNVWLKIDTGMHRLGFAPSEVATMHARLLNCASVKKPVGLMTHFADADLVNRPTTLHQQAIFTAVTQHLAGPCSLANSAGILAWPTTHADWVRPGIMLYGASPFPQQSGIDQQLKPVMTLRSALIAIHQVPQGAQIGYGGIWTCPETMPIGVVGAGYGDGYPRHAPNGTPVLVNGQTCPLIGRVSMDMLMVDLRSQPAAKVGDPVVLWGEGLPVEVIAGYSNTNSYELLTKITGRVTQKIRTS